MTTMTTNCFGICLIIRFRIGVSFFISKLNLASKILNESGESSTSLHG